MHQPVAPTPCGHPLGDREVCPDCLRAEVLEALSMRVAPDAAAAREASQWMLVLDGLARGLAEAARRHALDPQEVPAEVVDAFHVALLQHAAFMA